MNEYVLISQAEPQVERYRRREDGWQYCDSLDGFVDLVTGARLEMIELYANLPE